MNSSESSSSYCWREKKRCVSWVEKYFKDCLCNVRDDISFGCGVLSLSAWAVAEIPQIITNFRTKSSHGVSLFFLLTWVLGDFFNLVGCLLEPSTLPTQFYTALLYTISTIVLVLQTLYYDHFYSWWKCRHNKSLHQQDEEEKKTLNPKPTDKSGIPIPSTPVRVRTSQRREFYYTSARSLAGSDTPPFRSYLPRSGPSAVGHDDDSSSEDEQTNAIPTRRSSQARQIPRPSARGAALAAASASLPIQGNAFFNGRRMLNEHSVEHNALGQWLGWLMAAIYMGGRIPQIVLNIKRGSVEGLNPLMFIFALIANVAYVGSILVRTTEWERIKANMPWLLDAVVCVMLDLFIIMQYVYYKYVKKKNSREDEFYYEEVGKAVVS